MFICFCPNRNKEIICFFIVCVIFLKKTLKPKNQKRREGGFEPLLDLLLWPYLNVCWCCVVIFVVVGVSFGL